MADDSKPRMCVDRVVPLAVKKHAAELAFKENRKNIPVLPHLPGVSRHPVKIAIEAGKIWQKGRTLRVHFLDGSATQRSKVQAFASQWLKFANLKFDFNGGKDSEIRVSFTSDPGSSWSAVGTDCLYTEYFKPGEPTMNYGWLEDNTDDEEYSRVAIHEFGHAIGAIHEHQNPKGGIEWNVEAVYAYFQGSPNFWSKEEIDHNVLEKYSIEQLNASKFDRKSIMLYSFPAELLKSGVGTPSNSRLSAGDKKFIAKWYSKGK